MNKIDFATLLACILLLIIVFGAIIFNREKKKLLSTKKTFFAPKIIVHKWEQIPQIVPHHKYDYKLEIDEEDYSPISKKLVLENHEQYCFENYF